MEFYTGVKKGCEEKEETGKESWFGVGVGVGCCYSISTFGYLRLVCVDETGSGVAVTVIRMWSCDLGRGR